jgi:DNA-binding beta-propeller fold protein YncE
MKNWFAVLLGSFIAACLAGHAVAQSEAQGKQPKTSPDIAAVAAGEAVSITATVEKIDLKKRLVTLKGPEGNEVTIHVDKRVKNLPQVKKGDQVVVDYLESVAVDLRKPGEPPEVAAAGGVATAKPGEMPGGIAVKRIRVTAKISAIDAAKSTVTLTGPRGNAFPVKVKDPARLEQLKVGDDVDVTYTEALAIAVKKPTQTQ